MGNPIHIPTATGTLVCMPEESVAEFAKRAGVSPRRVRALIEQGAIPARQVGRQWLIDQSCAHRPAASRPLADRMRANLLAILSETPLKGFRHPNAHASAATATNSCTAPSRTASSVPGSASRRL